MIYAREAATGSIPVTSTIDGGKWFGFATATRFASVSGSTPDSGSNFVSQSNNKIT